MSCITVIVMTTKDKFIPFIDSILPIVFNIFSSGGDEFKIVRNRALEFLGKIVMHCGYQYIQPQILNILTYVDRVGDCLI